MKKTFLRTVGVFVATLMLCLGALPAYAADKTYYNVVPQRFIAGDKIYYDNSETGWEKVRIYMWSDVSVLYVGQDPYDWVDRPEMTRIGGTDIWEYEVPTIEPFCTDLARSGNIDSFDQCVSYYSSPYYDMTAYDAMWGDVGQLLFTDGADQTDNKTSDLDYIANGLMYKSTKNDGSEGEWYLESHSLRTTLINMLHVAKAYADKINCVEEEEAQSFVNAINQFEDDIDDMTLVHIDQTGIWTYSEADIMEFGTDIATAIRNARNKYGNDPKLCEDSGSDNESDDKSDNPDTFDTIGLFAGLGVASFAGLAISLNRKRRA